MVRNLRRPLAISCAAVAVAAGVAVTVSGASAAVMPADRQITNGMNVPWGVTFLPDRSAYVAERNTGRIFRVTEAGARTMVGVVPGTNFGGEGGLLGLAVAPGFSASGTGRLFAYQTVRSGNRIVRINVRNNRFAAPDVTQILAGITRSTFHNGGRLRFGPDGMLYATTGDAQTEGRNSQDPRSLNGKILRMTQDGRLRTIERAPVGGYWMTTAIRHVVFTPLPVDDRFTHVT